MDLAAKLLKDRKSGGWSAFSAAIVLLAYMVFLELLLDCFLRNFRISLAALLFCLAGTAALMAISALFASAWIPCFRGKTGREGRRADASFLFRCFLPVSLANIMLGLRGYAFFWKTFGTFSFENPWLAAAIPLALVLLSSVAAFGILARLARGGRTPQARALALTLSLGYFTLAVGFIKINGEFPASPLAPAALLRSGLLLLGVLLLGTLFLRTLARAAGPGRGLSPRTLLAAAVASVAAVALLNVLWLGADRYGVARPAARAPADASRPHIILLVVDSLRADRLALLGHERDTAPNLDALARTSTLFTRAVAQSSWTLPSVTSLLTGLTAGIHGTFAGGFAGAMATALQEEFLCSEEIRFLPEMLRPASYHTLAISSNVFVADRYCRGFDAFYSDASPYTLLLFPHLLGDAYTAPLARRVYHWAYGMGFLDKDYFYRDACSLNRRALRWLDRAPAGPVFLYVHYMDVHSPFLPPVKRFSAVPGRPLLTFFDIVGRRLDPAGIPEEALQGLRDRYDDGILSFDRSLGLFLDALRERGLFDSSLILFTSDHGEELREHGRFGHGHAVYQELVHVPLLVKLPGQKSARRVDTPVELTFLAPTILAAAGVRELPDYPLEGRDLLPLLLGDEEGFRPKPYLVSEIETGETAILDGDWKLIYRPGPEEDLFFLYNLREDPGETEDLFLDEPRAAKEMVERFLDYQQYKDRNRFDVKRRKLSPAQIDRLKALGYVQ